MSKEEGLKKIKFYDKCFWISIISFVLIFIFSYSLENLTGNLSFFIGVIACILFLISGAIFGWGMIYHAFKREEPEWLIANLFIPFLILYFYFGRVRKAFKRGETEYKEKINEKEKKQIEYYKEHRKEIDKKDNEEFIKFLKGIGIVVGLIILILIIKVILF